MAFKKTCPGNQEKLYWKAKMNGDFSKYKTYRNELVTELRNAKKKFILSLWILKIVKQSGKCVSCCTNLLAQVFLC